MRAERLQGTEAVSWARGFAARRLQTGCASAMYSMAITGRVAAPGPALDAPCGRARQHGARQVLDKQQAARHHMHALLYRLHSLFSNRGGPLLHVQPPL